MKISDWQELEKKLIWMYAGSPQAFQGTYERLFVSAWLIEEGNVTLRNQGEEVTVGAGNWVFPPTRTDTRIFSDEARILSVSFTLCWPDGRMLYEHQDPLSFPADQCPELEAAARNLLQVVEGRMHYPLTNLKWQTVDLNTFLELECWFPDWLRAYCAVMQKLGLKSEQFSREDQRVVKAKFMLDHLDMSRPFCVADIAGKTGLSVSHLNRLFQDEYGMSIRSYFAQRRQQAILSQLERSQMPMKEIAFSYGFKDAAAFSNWVKKNLGASPRAFRR